MKSDLSKCKVGDWIWNSHSGWAQIESINLLDTYPINIAERQYTTEGKYVEDDKYPSAFTVPPKEFNPGPEPCQFKKGDKVIVWDRGQTMKTKRHFSHTDGAYFYCFYNGQTEWTSEGEPTAWDNCIPAPEY